MWSTYVPVPNKGDSPVTFSSMLLLAAAPCVAFSATPPPGPVSWVLDWFRNSDLVAAKHAEHIASESPVHMLQGTAFAAASEAQKLAFARGQAGAAVAQLVRWEQEYLGEWKAAKIIEAAGAHDAAEARQALTRLVDHPKNQDGSEESVVVLFSFSDCPWCVAAKALLEEAHISTTVYELDDMGREGKILRAALARATGKSHPFGFGICHIPI